MGKFKTVVQSVQRGASSCRCQARISVIQKSCIHEAEKGNKPSRHKEEGNVKTEAETGLLKPQSMKTQGIPETGTELMQSCPHCEFRLLPLIKAR